MNNVNGIAGNGRKTLDEAAALLHTDAKGVKFLMRRGIFSAHDEKAEQLAASIAGKYGCTPNAVLREIDGLNGEYMLTPTVSASSLKLDEILGATVSLDEVMPSLVRMPLDEVTTTYAAELLKHIRGALHTITIDGSSRVFVSDYNALAAELANSSLVKQNHARVIVARVLPEMDLQHFDKGLPWREFCKKYGIGEIRTEPGAKVPAFVPDKERHDKYMREGLIAIISKLFISSLMEVVGRHDEYLRFLPNDNSREEVLKQAAMTIPVAREFVSSPNTSVGIFASRLVSVDALLKEAYGNCTDLSESARTYLGSEYTRLNLLKVDGDLMVHFNHVNVLRAQLKLLPFGPRKAALVKMLDCSEGSLAKVSPYLVSKSGVPIVDERFLLDREGVQDFSACVGGFVAKLYDEKKLGDLIGTTHILSREAVARMIEQRTMYQRTYKKMLCPEDANAIAADIKACATLEAGSCDARAVDNVLLWIDSGYAKLTPSRRVELKREVIEGKSAPLEEVAQIGTKILEVAHQKGFSFGRKERVWREDIDPILEKSETTELIMYWRAVHDALQVILEGPKNANEDSELTFWIKHNQMYHESKVQKRIFYVCNALCAYFDKSGLSSDKQLYMARDDVDRVLSTIVALERARKRGLLGLSLDDWKYIDRALPERAEDTFYTEAETMDLFFGNSMPSIAPIVVEGCDLRFYKASDLAVALKPLIVAYYDQNFATNDSLRRKVREVSDKYELIYLAARIRATQGITPLIMVKVDTPQEDGSQYKGIKTVNKEPCDLAKFPPEDYEKIRLKMKARLDVNVK